MSKKQRQQLLLGVLAVILVLVAGRRLVSLFQDDGFGTAGGRASSGRGVVAGGSDWRADLPQVEELHLAALEVGIEELNEGRDPFQIRRSEPPPQPKPDQSDLRKRIEEARKRQSNVAPRPARPPKPTPPPIDVVYLGSFGSGRMRLAVFTDGNEIFNVPEGDVLKDKFVVVKIGMESADLGFVGFPDAPAKRLEIGG